MDHVVSSSPFDSQAVDHSLTAEREIASALSHNAKQIWSHYITEETSEIALERIHQLATATRSAHTNSDGNVEEEDRTEPESVPSKPLPDFHQLGGSEQQHTSEPLEQLDSEHYLASSSVGLLTHPQSSEQMHTGQTQFLEMLAPKTLNELERKRMSESCEKGEKGAEPEIVAEVLTDDHQEIGSSQEDWEGMNSGHHQQQTHTQMVEEEGVGGKDWKQVLKSDLVSLTEPASNDKEGNDSSFSEDEYKTPPTSPTPCRTSLIPQLIEDSAINTDKSELALLSGETTHPMELGIEGVSELTLTIDRFQCQWGDDSDKSLHSNLPQPQVSSKEAWPVLQKLEDNNHTPPPANLSWSELNREDDIPLLANPSLLRPEEANRESPLLTNPLKQETGKLSPSSPSHANENDQIHPAHPAQLEETDDPTHSSRPEIDQSEVAEDDFGRHSKVDHGVNTDPRDVTDQTVNTPVIELHQISTNTDQVKTCQRSTNTDIDTDDKSFCTDHVETSEVAMLAKPVVQEKTVNTELSAFELLKRVHSMEKLERLEAENKIMAAELNEEKSKRMVGDSLSQMLQSELIELRQNNATEMTSRLRLENEVTSMKVELEKSRRELKEKESRVTELEESLQGTMHLVNRMEQQSAVMNKGGIDYLLLAKVAEGQAQESKQQMTVLQTELLHSQSEVQRLLDRIAELSRDRKEMVSSRVHTELLKLSDERAEAAERRVKELESQVMLLKSSGAGHNSSGGTPSFSPYPNLYGSSTSSVPSPYSTFDPFRVSTSSSYLSGVGTSLHSYAGSSMTSNTKPGSYGYSGLSGSGLGSYSSGSSGLELFGSSATGGLGSTKPSNRGLGLYESGSGLESISSSLGSPSAKSTLGTVSAGLTGQLSKDPYSRNTSDTAPSRSSFPDPTHVEGLTETSSFLDTLPELSALNRPPVSDGLAGKKPPVVKEDAGSTSLLLGSHAESDSSDWSSSGEEDSSTSKVDISQELRPSTHMNLRSKWEWWSQQQSGSPPTQPSGFSQQLPPAKGRKPPPPIAPKPKLLKSISLDHTIFSEPALSFEQPPSQPPLKVQQRPVGPSGRRLPSRFYGYPAPPQQDLNVHLPLF